MCTLWEKVAEVKDLRMFRGMLEERIEAIKDLEKFNEKVNKPWGEPQPAQHQPHLHLPIRLLDQGRLYRGLGHISRLMVPNSDAHLRATSSIWCVFIYLTQGHLV